MSNPQLLSGARRASVHGTALLATDTRQQYREKIARITLDSMVQFVGLLDAHGTVLEINKVALDAVGIKLSELEGRPFWTTFWWQVSPAINQGIRDAIARAAQGEFVRWDTPIYGRAGGSQTIIIDASVMPVKDDQGNVVFLACEGRDITEKKAQEAEIAPKNVELHGLLELRRERIDLGESLAAAVGTARPLIEARGHSLTVDAPPARVEIDADPVRFAQILSNLLTNAAKYTDPGGRIRVKAHVSEGDAVIRVQDNGIGIAPELQPHLFEMFSQATSALDRSEGGLGIGLSLTRGLVALHAGTIEVRSPGLGAGSELIVRLPLAHASPSPREHGRGEFSSAATEARRPVRILIADDNRDSADGSATLLQLDGHDVRVAYSGAEALRVVEAFAPHVALLDIGMPGMNGYELARRIRATDAGRNILLVAVMGWGQDEDKRRAEAAGFDEHRTKPVDFASLGELIARSAPRAG